MAKLTDERGQKTQVLTRDSSIGFMLKLCDPKPIRKQGYQPDKCGLYCQGKKLESSAA